MLLLYNNNNNNNNNLFLLLYNYTIMHAACSFYVMPVVYPYRRSGQVLKPVGLSANSGLASNVMPYSHVHKSDKSHFYGSIDVFTLDLFNN